MNKRDATWLGCGGLLVIALTSSFFGATASNDSPDDWGTGGAESSASASPTTSPTPEPTDDAPNVPGKKGEALRWLGQLRVKRWDRDVGYDRETKFGYPWEDVDGNGCDTRNDILARDFRTVTSTDGCIVYRGVLHDMYTGKLIRFTRGTTTSLAVQVDHVVALHNAWLTGAQKLTQGMRVAFANDPLNLEAVDGPTNLSKSDDDASWWLPPKRSSRCEYVARQISVKREYQLWVTADEKIAMQSVLATCPRQRGYDSDYPEMLRRGELYVD